MAEATRDGAPETVPTARAVATGARAVGHERLVVWQQGMDLVEECYRLSRSFPSDERFGLSSQLRRAAVSIPANIAEGNGRGHPGQFAAFLDYARGSAREVETLVEIVVRLGLATREQAAPARQRADLCGRMITALMRKVRK